MTENLIAMARKAGAWPELSTTPKKDVEFLRRFAALIEARAVARTREECAKAIDKRGLSKDEQDCPSAVNGWWPDQVLFRCAQAIRALGERT